MRWKNAEICASSRTPIQDLQTLHPEKIPRSKNKQEDVLIKLASKTFDHLTKKVLVEILPERSIDIQEVVVVETSQPNWMTSYFDYLLRGILPEDIIEARNTKIKSPQYTIHGRILYRKSYLAPWLKCVTQLEGMAILQETDAGDAGAHEEPGHYLERYFALESTGPTLIKT